MWVALRHIKPDEAKSLAPGVLAMDIVPATEESQPQDPNSTT
jgi:hypothetical protein